MQKKIFRQHYGFLLIFPLLFFQTNQQPADNLTILNHLASNLMSKIVDQVAPDATDEIMIQSQSRQNPGNWWVENWLVKELSGRGLTKIYVQQQKSFVNGATIEFLINKLGVTYLPTDNKKYAIRQFIINLDVRLLDGGAGFVKSLDNVSEQFADTVQVNLLKQLEDKSYPFTSAVAPMNQGIRKYVEPFVVMATTAGVIVMFFQFRSK